MGDLRIVYFFDFSYNRMPWNLMVMLKLHFFPSALPFWCLVPQFQTNWPIENRLFNCTVYYYIIYILDMELYIYNYIILYIGIYTLYPCIEKASHVLYSWRQVVESKIGFDGNRLYSWNISTIRWLRCMDTASWQWEILQV